MEIAHVDRLGIVVEDIPRPASEPASQPVWGPDLESSRQNPIFLREGEDQADNSSAIAPRCHSTKRRGTTLDQAKKLSPLLCAEMELEDFMALLSN